MLTMLTKQWKEQQPVLKFKEKCFLVLAQNTHTAMDIPYSKLSCQEKHESHSQKGKASVSQDRSNGLYGTLHLVLGSLLTLLVLTILRKACSATV